MISTQKRLELAVEVLNAMKPKIKKELLNTKFQDRHDLEQEISLKLIEAIIYDRIKQPPNFWDFKEQLNDRRNL